MSGVRIAQLRPQHATGRRYGSFAGRVPATLAAVTGTATAGIAEADVVAGGKTVIVTLTNDTWVAAGAAFDAQRQNIVNGLDSAQSEANGWNAKVRDLEVVGAVVRTSNTVATIALSASAVYDITATETITVTVPFTALATSPIDVTATPTFQVTPVAVTREGAGYIVGPEVRYFPELGLPKRRKRKLTGGEEEELKARLREIAAQAKEREILEIAPQQLAAIEHVLEKIRTLQPAQRLAELQRLHKDLMENDFILLLLLLAAID